MRVVAARFREARRASAALDVLRRRLQVPPLDVAVAPLGTPGQPPSDDAVLAGRFPDEQAPVVVDLVRREGGEVVADIDEIWTRPRQAQRQSLETQPRGKTAVWMGNRGQAS